MSAGQPFRLSSGGLIERDRSLSFSYDGLPYSGHAGDTLASALLANGVRLVGRSFKYHRPRGILTAGSEEPNALVELRAGARREPNTRATVAELFDGLEANSQNCWPSVHYDIGSINNLLSPMFVAGFYYKTFMWPASFWEKIYEPLIRRAAGLGRAADAPDPDAYEKAHAFCDVLVIGAGPAGLAAALAAGRTGARVILCDEDFVLGGRLNNDRCVVADQAGTAWRVQAEAELAAMVNVRLMPRTTVFGTYDGGTYGALERVADHLVEPAPGEPRQRFWHIVAKRAVLAAGAIERPIVFPGNDRPGVMTASAVRTYVNRYGVAPGRRVCVFTATDDGRATARNLTAAGVQVAAVIDPRETAMALDGVETFTGAAVIGTEGRKQLKAIRVRRSDGSTVKIDCDCLAVSGGWSPSIALTTHLGGRPVWNDDIAAFVPGALPKGMTVAGAANGAYALADCLAAGVREGETAAADTGFAATGMTVPRAEGEATGGGAFWYVECAKGKAFVDLQHDVSADDILLAAREGFTSVEHAKRYTTLGMATDQGKTSNINGHAVIARVLNKGIAEVGTTVMRPPYTPVAIGALAGASRGMHFRPARLAAWHDWAVEQGATFVETGAWMRAQWFSRPGETDWLQSVTREVKSVRTDVGVCDVTTLGKIDVQGADAAAFLDRVYCNTFSTLPVGKVRYGLMLREDGFVMDDGTSARFADDHYVMTTTTANAGRVMQHLDFAAQVLWPDMDVQLTSVTEQWAQYSVAGPKSRLLLQALFGDTLDVSNEAFPYLACRAFPWRGTKVRLFRISYSGELAYEIAVPARFGDTLIREIMKAGAPYNVAPYGTEALGVLRIEKGHVSGNELNGATTAADIGLGRMMSKKKDFIGRVLAGRPGLTDPLRPALVGLKPVDAKARVGAGAHLFAADGPIEPKTDQGYVTSVCYSPMAGQWIGLGLLTRGPQRMGEVVRLHDPVRRADVLATVCSPVFFDPEGARLVS